MRKLLPAAAVVLLILVGFRTLIWTLRIVTATLGFALKFGVLVALIGIAVVAYRKLRRRRAPRALGTRASTLDFILGRVDATEYLRAERERKRH